MNIAQLSNTLLKIFYIMIGLYMGLTMVFTLKDKNHKTRIGTSLFWGILSVVFMFGDYIPSQIVGALKVLQTTLKNMMPLDTFHTHSHQKQQCQFLRHTQRKRV